MNKKNLSGAPLVMHKRGQKTDATILEEVKKRPGSTISEIANRLGWSNGRVDGSVNRLASNNKVSIKHCLKKSMLIKKVYPTQTPIKPHNIIEVSRENIEYDVWKDNAKIYALSRSTIGISPTEIDEWNKKALLKEEVPIQKKEEGITIELSEALSEFYQLENSDISSSIIGNSVLVTVESILPVELPAYYPEALVTYHKRRIILFEEEEITASSFNPYQSTILPEGVRKTLHIPSEALQSISRKKPQEKVRLTGTSAEKSEEHARRIKIPVRT